MGTVTYSIIIPAFNEEDHLAKLTQQLRAAGPEAELVVVDDGSSDATGKMLVQESCLKTIWHPYNIGNGAAIKSGIRAASGDILIFMDGDGQHDPEDIPELLAHMDRYDMVVGARSNGQQASQARGWMNRIYNRLASYVTGFKVEDLTSGFRAVRAETAREMLPLLPNSYSWPTTMTLVLLRSGLRLKYVPVHVQPRRHGRSRIRPVRDGIRFFMIILKICTLYSPLRVFLPVSGTMFVLGLINYAYTYLTEGRFTNMSALMFTTAVIIFMMGLISEQVSQIGLLRQQVGHSKQSVAGDDHLDE